MLTWIKTWGRWRLLIQVLGAAALSFGLLLTTGIWEQTRPLPGPITHELGDLYISGRISASLPTLFYVPSDNVGGSSTLQLFQGSKQLGPAHSSHQQIRDLGNGRYSHWSGRVWFSIPDRGQLEDLSVRYSIRLKPTLMWLFFLLAVLPALLARITINAAKQLLSACAQRLRSDPFTVLISAICLAGATAFIPQTWDGVDSIAIVLWPNTCIPHWPFGYLLLVSGMESILGLSAGVKAVLYIQIGIFFFALVYFLFSFASPIVRFIILFFIFTQLYILMVERGIYTEATGFSGLFLIIGATLRQSQQEKTGNILAYVWGTLLCGLSRYPFIAFGAILPLYILLTALWARSRRLLWQAIGLSSFLLLTFLLLTPSSQLICRLLGNINCESSYGLVGGELVKAALLRLPADQRSREVQKLKDLSADPLVKDFFDAAANEKVRGGGGILEDMRAKHSGKYPDAATTDQLLEEQRAAAQGTNIFKIYDWPVFFDQFINELNDYIFNTTVNHAYVIINYSKEAIDRILSEYDVDARTLIKDQAYTRQSLDALERSAFIRLLNNFSSPMHIRAVVCVILVLAFISGDANIILFIISVALTYFIYFVGMSASAPETLRYAMTGEAIIALCAAGGLGLFACRLLPSEANGERGASHRRTATAARDGASLRVDGSQK